MQMSCVQVYTQINTYAFAHIYAQVSTNVYMNAYTYVHPHIHAHVHTHVHAQVYMHRFQVSPPAPDSQGNRVQGTVLMTPGGIDCAFSQSSPSWHSSYSH